MNNLGIDKVETAEKCYLLAKKWLDTSGSKESAAIYKRMEENYRKLATTHVLYKYNLHSPAYSKLIQQPTQLVTALYEDDQMNNLWETSNICSKFSHYIGKKFCLEHAR